MTVPLAVSYSERCELCGVDGAVECHDVRSAQQRDRRRQFGGETL
jgi:hypothetical protein